MSMFYMHHTLEILKAAYPYLNSRSKDTLELFIRAGDFFECLQKRRNKSYISTLSFQNEDQEAREDIDILGLLKSVREVCYEDEIKLIDSLIHLVNIMEMYKSYMDLFSMMSGDGGLDGLGSMFGMGDVGNPEDMLNVLSSMLSPEDKENLDNISMVLNMMNASKTVDSQSSDQEEGDLSHDDYDDGVDDFSDKYNYYMQKFTGNNPDDGDSYDKESKDNPLDEKKIF